jgi:peptidoglycan/LPS O-acetylase OafA/YrhL
MAVYIDSLKCRKGVDALRAFAVVMVFIFHGGYFENGYLGAGVFCDKWILDHKDHL